MSRIVNNIQGIGVVARGEIVIEPSRSNNGAGSSRPAKGVAPANGIEQETSDVMDVEATRLEKMSTLCQGTVNAIIAGATWETITDDFKPQFESIMPGRAPAKIEEVLKTRQFDPAKEPPPLRAIYSLGGQCIATPGNLSTITAQIKTGKSAVIGAMLAAPMTQRDGADCLGFTSQNPQGLAVLHFDSEQSADDHWRCVRRDLKRAGLDTSPPWFYSYCLTGLGCQMALRCVLEAVQQAAELNHAIHSIFLDGYADFVADVNNPAESNAFVAQVHGLAIKYNCPIIGVIHFNPGGEKVRGHLGSQLERKAETNLRLDKADDVTTIWSAKQRRAPISKDSGPCFKWSDEVGMHVSVSSRSARKSDAERGDLLAQFQEAFSGRGAMRYSELKAAVISLLTVSPRTAERYIKRAGELGILKINSAGRYTIGI